MYVCIYIYTHVCHVNPMSSDDDFDITEVFPDKCTICIRR